MEVSGQLHAPAALPPGIKTLVPIGQEVGPTAILDAVVKRKISTPRRESNPNALYLISPKISTSQYQVQENKIWRFFPSKNCIQNSGKETCSKMCTTGRQAVRVGGSSNWPMVGFGIS
jgi:hypothetical protein